MGLFVRKNNSYQTRWTRTYVYETAITGMLIGVNLLVKFAFDLIPGAPAGISVSPVYFVIIASVYLLKHRLFALALVLISPWLWLAIGRAPAVNIADFVVEYLLPVVATFLYTVVPLFEKKGRPSVYSWLVLFGVTLLVMAAFKPFMSFLAGVEWYGTTFVGSVIFNAPNMYFDFGLTTVLLAISYLPLSALRRAVR